MERACGLVLRCALFSLLNLILFGVGFAMGGLLYSSLISDDDWEAKMDVLAAAIKKKTRWSDPAGALKTKDDSTHEHSPPAPALENAAPPQAPEPVNDAADSSAPAAESTEPESLDGADVVRFNVGSNQVLGFLAGLYVNRGVVYDGYPVYHKHEMGLDIVIAYATPHMEWVIKPESELGQASGWAFIRPTNAPCALLEAKGSWWAPANGEYVQDPSISVTRYNPDEEKKEKKKLALSFSGFVETCNFLNGTYTQTDETFNGYPIYQRDEIIIELTSGMWFFKPLAQKHVYTGWAICKIGKNLEDCSGIWECANSDLRSFSEHVIQITVV
jgi:hypothetical protein